MSIEKCYHGTNTDSAKSILSTEFRPSNDGKEYIGTGAYFFMDGLCCPMVAGSRWARHFHSKSPSLIKSEIDFGNSKVLRLNTSEGKKIFNILKDAFLRQLSDKNILVHHYNRNRDRRTDKSEISNAVIDAAGLDIVVKDEYVPIVADPIEKNLYLGITNENCTVVNVVNIKKIISSEMISLVR